jgi:hypothetical protein
MSSQGRSRRARSEDHVCEEVSNHRLISSVVERMTGCRSCNQLRALLASVVIIAKVYVGCD